MPKIDRAEQGIANAQQSLHWARKQPNVTPQQVQLIDRALVATQNARDLFAHTRSATQ